MSDKEKIQEQELRIQYLEGKIKVFEQSIKAYHKKLLNTLNIKDKPNYTGGFESVFDTND